MISIIVPVYNTEKYLDRCIQSILAQTYTDFELLLINDGSTDSSGAICDKYAEQDSRVRVFHKDNGGVSSARNIGLDNVRGERVCFIDSDDWVESNYLEVLNKDADLTVSALVYENGTTKVEEKLQSEKILLSGNNITAILMKGAFMGPTCKLFRSDIIEDKKLRFDKELYSREDTLWVYQYILNIKTIAVIENVTYHYCITGSGLSSKIIDINQSKYALELFHQCFLEFERNFVGYDMTVRYIWMIHEIFKNMLANVTNAKTFKERRALLSEILQNKQVLDLLKCENSEIYSKGFKRKVWDYLALHRFMGILTLYYNFYKYE